MIHPARTAFSSSTSISVQKASSYEQTLDYLYGLQRIGIKLGLHNIRTLLQLAGQPQLRFDAVHIAGTNGKGSTAAFMASILQAAGYKVGLYTSPHLIDFTERIKVNAQPISPADVVRITSTLKELIAGNPHFDLPSGTPPTFFEFTTALAFCCFAEANVDIAVVEAGMGGRLDATNVLIPKLSIITNISLEHQQYLGNTTEEIAREKAGIVKPGITVLCGAKQVKVQEIIRQVCQAESANLCLLEDNFDWRYKFSKQHAQYFDLRTPQATYHDLSLGLLGDFQLTNAAMAVGAVELLIKQGIAVPEAAIREGLAKPDWDGRLQLISQKPYLVLDGAHNPQASKALSANLPIYFNYDSLILVLGILKDKDIAGILNEWIDTADILVLTRPDSERAANPLDMAQLIPPHKKKHIIIKESIAEALNFTRQLAKPSDLVCLTGSLYTVGEALAILRGQEGGRRKSNQ
jgi:dihydrofolate synthase/folylpolyglutamate synthase